MDHLVRGLTPQHGFFDLNVHTLWALLTLRPHLLRPANPANRLLRRHLPVMLDGSGLSSRARRELEGPRAVTGDQTTGMPPVLAVALRELIAEYEAKETPEAVCARDADKLECMLQGVEYKAQGHENAQRWIDNSRNRLTTGTARRLADELLSQGPLDWLRAALGETER